MAETRGPRWHPTARVHRTADVDLTAALGPGVNIAAGCTVGPDAVLGDNVSLARNASVGAGAKLGGEVALGKGARVGAGAQLEFGVKLGPQAYACENSFAGHAAEIGKGCVLGANSRLAQAARLVPGPSGVPASVGRNSRIGMESVLAGSPAGDKVEIGHGVKMEASVVRSGGRVGELSSLDSALVEEKCSLGRASQMLHGTALKVGADGRSTTIGARCRLAPGAVFSAVDAGDSVRAAGRASVSNSNLGRSTYVDWNAKRSGENTPPNGRLTAGLRSLDLPGYGGDRPAYNGPSPDSQIAHAASVRAAPALAQVSAAVYSKGGNSPARPSAGYAGDGPGRDSQVSAR